MNSKEGDKAKYKYLREANILWIPLLLSFGFCLAWSDECCSIVEELFLHPLYCDKEQFLWLVGICVNLHGFWVEGNNTKSLEGLTGIGG